MTLYSHSRISCFENCPYKYKLKYIDKIKPEIETSIEAFLGSMVHDTLERLYKDMRFQKINTIEEILAYYNEIWTKNWVPNIIIVRKDYTQENFRAMGEVFIRDYYNKHHPFDQTKTIGLEKRIVIDLENNGKYKLQGYIDRLSCKNAGEYEIHDYKTNSSLPQIEYLKKDRQLALYAMAVKKIYPDAENIKLIWHFLSFNKDIVLEKTDEELEQLKHDTKKAIDAIESASSYPTVVTKLCDWCEFRSKCPEWGHIAKTDSMSLNTFIGESGVKLVNEYAELTNKKKGLEEEIEKIKEKILAYSKEKSLNIMTGTSHNVRIWRANKFKFPGRDEPRREELEDFLRKANLWNDVSSLDTFILSKKMDNPEWPDDITKAIEKFGNRETIERLYLKKKDGDK